MLWVGNDTAANEERGRIMVMMRKITHQWYELPFI